ncbi:hypothetical protein VF_A0635 [Aliivibrio fischeri ES114]|uniref:Uncharacterized protein n=1 Tax=Aliivibrio fischeri (strain ATCC 700601 / ES114) TaxID=312309 RepID=Q5DZU1_ALIF1|nr:hypothetical protein [Aliivibrio fischeri]AAW87705.1 hypothetical protein VF_A0635 [Aliivibrio fischeri ES114]KLU78144.1 hypothetical protein AB192_13285 [Aliivibrio fischeri]
MRNKLRIILIFTALISVLSGVARAEKHKDFGDYTTYVVTQNDGVIYKQANVKLDGIFAELAFHSRSNSENVFAFVNKQKVQLIVDGIIMDNKLDHNEVTMIKNAHNIAVIHGNRTYLISTKGSGASMIYITDFPMIEREDAKNKIPIIISKPRVSNE